MNKIRFFVGKFNTSRLSRLDKFLNLLIVILFIIAVSLGVYSFYINGINSGSFADSDSGDAVVEGSSSNGSVDSSSSILNSDKLISFSDLSKEERDIILGVNSSKDGDAQGRHFELITKLSQESSFIDVSACSEIRPYVYKLDNNQNVVFKNNSSVDASIYINSIDTTYVVPAKSEIRKTLNFEKMGGYGYTCSSSDSGFGIINFQ